MKGLKLAWLRWSVRVAPDNMWPSRGLGWHWRWKQLIGLFGCDSPLHSSNNSNKQTEVLPDDNKTADIVFKL